MISKEEHRKQIIGIAERRLESLKTGSEYKKRLREAMPDE